MTVVFKVPVKPKPKTTRKRRKRKTKEKPPKPMIGAVMDPTQDFFQRERVMKRVTLWKWRMAKFIRDMNKEQCGSCQMNSRCNRVPLDSKTTRRIISGKKCEDHRSVWKKIIGNEEDKHDWGF